MKPIPSSRLILLGVALVIGVPLASRADARVPQEAPAAQEADTVVAMHERAMLYPSAMQCASCHPDQARQWSVSPHAYTMVSPVFQAMAGFVGRHTQGTNGDFCLRCHSPAGMAIGESIFMGNAQRQQVSREGITCIGCHRVNRNYGRISGRQAVLPGDVYETVYGPSDGSELARVKELAEFQLSGGRGERGMAVHQTSEQFFEMNTPAFCGTCHEFLNHPGLRNQETLAEYRHSPSAKAGVTCQDCHMGTEPGTYTGSDTTNYSWGPAALVNGRPTRSRRLSNHMMVGPDHSLIHPGIFPLNPRALEMAEVDEWAQFDWKGGWGTDEFEDGPGEDFEFPEAWDNYDDRLDARDVIDDNLSLLNEYMGQRLTLLRNGYSIGEIRVKRASRRRGIKLEVQVDNVTDGHSVPTGFSIRPVYLRVTVANAQGDTVYKSGDLDPNGDFRDRNSVYVRNGALPLDGDLFNLQPKFIVRNMFGGEREEVVPVNFSPSPLPFLRPQPRSYMLMGRPLGVRIQRHSIRPGAHRSADYSVDSDLLTDDGPYEVNVKLVAPMIPVALIGTIQEMGFEFGMTARQLADRVVSGHTVIWEYEGSLDLAAGPESIEWRVVEAVPFRFEDLR
jgi:hypothetical protein